MKVYSKLLLSAGGGIISTQQQANQVGNTATVLIGLGGTGIDCLRTIKTQVYSRLKPDDPSEVVPKYSHIRFIGVDSDNQSVLDIYNTKNKNLPLEYSEFFHISSKGIKNQDLLKLPEFEWFRRENICVTDFGRVEASGIRQISRFMMMNKSDMFMRTVTSTINSAKSGLANATVNVHIFAGISGATGSGSFLDVCYMVRHIAEQIGGVTIFGYFFLPDVNLSRIPTGDNLTRAYVTKIAYAAMQELDYCMQIKENGGEFIQDYQGHRRIEWKEAPVDMCHLISATNVKGELIPNAYKYAMNVTAEYIMNFLIASSGDVLGLPSQLANYCAKVTQANWLKEQGFNLKYCTLGAASAGIPLREINTYLASELFERFSTIGGNTPTKADVEALELSALAKGRKNESEVYDSLLMEIREGADDNYAPYTDDWRYVREYGNSDLVLNYTNQTAKKLNSVEANAKSMVSENNEKSLIGRIRAALGNIICDIDKGPIFAYKMLSAFESHNLLNKIDGLIEENKNRWGQEAYQSTLRKKDYEEAKSDFENRHNHNFFDNDQKRFSNYEFYLGCLEKHKLMVGIYEKLDDVLTKLRKQIEDSTAGYYIKLYRVMETLINSFKENRKALESEKTIENSDGFTIPMMTIGELKLSLDAEIENINIPNMLYSFMKLLLDNEKSWMDEDESKITKLVTGFFVNNAFGNFANKTITAFLRDRYGNPTDEVLKNRIFDEWMKKLTDKAEPLLPYNEIWGEARTSKLAYLSVPTISVPIQAAARKMLEQNCLWQIKETDLTDRISAIVTHCALPLCSYRGYEMYERACFASSEVGRHYYEGKAVEGMRFNDWRKLPSLTPRSLVNMDMIPFQLKDIISEAEDLYVEAVDNNVFDDQNRICTPDEHDISKIQELIKECDSLAENMQDVSQLELAKEKIEELNVAPANINMVATRYSIPNDGHQDTTENRDRLRRDYFISFPVCQMEVRDILKQIKGIKEEIEQAKSKLQNKIDIIASIDDYFDAIFTGVINIEGTVVSYHSNEFGKDDIILSKCDKTEYPFCTIPLYQAFINYQNIDKETKAEIANRVSNAYNVEYEKIQETGKLLKEVLGAGKLETWLGLTKIFAERDDIVYFLKKLMSKC